MFVQAWNIYLPVIKILIKKAAAGEQVLGMNKTDFERAAGGRKAKLTFSFTLINNRTVGQSQTIPPVATELITLLQNDNAVRQMMQDGEFVFSMTSAFELKIIKS